MRWILFVATLCTTIHVLAQRPTTPAETVPLHLAEATRGGSLTLSEYTNEDEEGFRSLDMRLGEANTHITPRHPIACIPQTHAKQVRTGLWQRIDGAALDASRCFFRAEFVDTSGTHSLLIFLSEGWASDAAPSLVIGLHADGHAYKVLELDEFDPAAIDTSSKGVRIVGKPTLSQVMGGDGGNGSKQPYATTYDPYAVYVVKADETAHYSLEESRSYNMQHYVWAGPRSREDYAVLYNLPGHPKPFGTSADKVSALLESKGEAR